MLLDNGSVTSLSNEMKMTDGPIDATGWTENEKLNQFLTGQLTNIFNQEPPILFFPIQLCNRPDDYDPVTVGVDLPLRPMGGDMVSFECSLESAVDDLIDMYINWHTGKVDDDDEGGRCCKAVATRLRELANKLEDAVLKSG